VCGCIARFYADNPRHVDFLTGFLQTTFSPLTDNKNGLFRTRRLCMVCSICLTLYEEYMHGLCVSHLPRKQELRLLVTETQRRHSIRSS